MLKPKLLIFLVEFFNISWNMYTALNVSERSSGENPAAQNSQLSDLSNAWSSNLLDCLTTLALIQSNNGEPNWGPNHATKHTVELLSQTGCSPSYITLIMVWNPGWLQKCPACPPISLSCSYLRSPGQVCVPMCKTPWYCLFMTDFSHSRFVGKVLSAWEGERL